MNTEQMVNFIQSHSIRAQLVNGEILAEEKYSDGSTQVVRIEPTLVAVRDWLGY